MQGDKGAAGRQGTSELFLLAPEIEILGRIINALGVAGSQLILRHRPELYLKAQVNLRKFKAENEDLLKRLDQLARRSKDEGALRLIEDLEILPLDAVQSLQGARRCLLAAAFLGHCIAMHSHPPNAAVAPQDHKRPN